MSNFSIRTRRLKHSKTYVNKHTKTHCKKYINNNKSNKSNNSIIGSGLPVNSSFWDSITIIFSKLFRK